MNSIKIISVITLIIISATACNQSNGNKIILQTKTAQPQTLPTFLIYGELAPTGYVEDKDSLTTKRFGFGLKGLAVWEVTSELIDSVKKINTKNNVIMKAKYGNDWKKKFEEQSKLKIAIPEI